MEMKAEIVAEIAAVFLEELKAIPDELEIIKNISKVAHTIPDSQAALREFLELMVRKKMDIVSARVERVGRVSILKEQEA